MDLQRATAQAAMTMRADAAMLESSKEAKVCRRSDLPLAMKTMRLTITIVSKHIFSWLYYNTHRGSRKIVPEM